MFLLLFLTLLRDKKQCNRNCLPIRIIIVILLSAFQINIAQNALKVHKVLEHMMMYINKL